MLAGLYQCFLELNLKQKVVVHGMGGILPDAHDNASMNALHYLSITKKIVKPNKKS